MRNLRWLVAILMFVSPWVEGSEAPDYQFRGLLHRGAKDGWAPVEWVIVPDATAETKKLFLLWGSGFGAKPNWVELMGGMFVSEDGLVDPTGDIRASVKIGRVQIFNEVQYTFRTKRLLIGPALTAQFRLWKLKGGIGVESDIFFGRDEKHTGVGPRFVASFEDRVALVTTYHFRKGQNIVRNYLLINF